MAGRGGDGIHWLRGWIRGWMVNYPQGVNVSFGLLNLDVDSILLVFFPPPSIASYWYFLVLETGRICVATSRLPGSPRPNSLAHLSDSRMLALRVNSSSP